MHCFRHHAAEAVGLCKGCGKALCSACVAEVGGSLACRDACEELVRTVDRLTALGRRSMRRSPRVCYTLGAIGAALVATFATGSLLAGQPISWLGLFPLVAFSAAFVWGGYRLSKAT